MRAFKTQILLLEKAAKAIEPDAAERKIIRDKVIAYSESFLETMDDHPTYNYEHNSGMGLLDAPLSDAPENLEKLLGLMGTEVDRPGLNPASQGHLGYIPGGGIYTSSLGDYMADVSNRYAGVFYASPGAVRMENMLLRWMSELVGYPAESGGNLSSGGSIANLIAIVTARDFKKINSSNITKSVIYASAHQHHCLDKAIRIAGLRECIVRYIPLDDAYSIKADLLSEQIIKDKAAGLNPWLVIASAGTTDAGAIDPLDEIGDIAKAHDLWYHVDAAYGGFFMLVESVKHLFKGIEKSDSVVMDPHKGLFLPYGSGVVIVKNLKALKKSHDYDANYMQDTLDYVEEVSPAEVSPELTKHFRGLRLWLPLKLHGIQPFRACLEEKLLLAEYFEITIRNTLGFVTGGAPQLSVVTFRYLPKNGDADAFNKALIQYVNREGSVFLSSTLLNDVFTIRLAVLAFRTRLKTIERAIEVLNEGVEHLKNQA